MEKVDKIGKLLVAEGVLTEAKLKEGLAKQQESYGKPLGEILLANGFIKENDFLRVLAKQFRTQYVATETLSELSVPESALKKVPLEMAEKYTILPIMYKQADRTLTLAIVDPNNIQAIDEVKFTSGVSNLKTLIALEDAIKSGIKKFYKGDENAFSSSVSGIDFDESAMGGGGSMDMSAFESTSTASPELQLDPPPDEDSPLDLGGISDAFTTPSQPQHNLGQDLGQGTDASEIFLQVTDQADPGKKSKSAAAAVKPADEKIVKPKIKDAVKEKAKKYRKRMLVVEPHNQIRKFISKLFAREGFDVTGVEDTEEVLNQLKQQEVDVVVIKERFLKEGSEFEEKVREASPNTLVSILQNYGGAMMGETRLTQKHIDSYFDTLDVIIGLMEVDREGLQGHTHKVTKYVKLLAQKLGLTRREMDEAVLAAYVHDLGRKGAPHLTLLDLEKEVEEENLKDASDVALNLLSGANLTIDIAPSLKNRFARFDGDGYPKNIKGDEIPVGARILAAVDSFEHLTTKGIEGTPMDMADAMSYIGERTGTLFDPKVTEVFLQIIRDDIKISQMDFARESILVVDTESDFTTLLELKFTNSGYRVTVSRSVEEALTKAKSNEPDMVISDIELGEASGFDLVAKFKDEGIEAPIVYLSKKDDSSLVNEAFQLGAEDVIFKPIKTEILFAKVNRIMDRVKRAIAAAAEPKERAAGGVSGNLSEMALPDIIQILGAGGRTGMVSIESELGKAEIYLENGRIVNAILGETKGEEAFYEIVGWMEGSFTISPDVEITERLIDKSNDSLMLEGFRRLDEGKGGEGTEDIPMDESGDFF